MIIGSDFLVSLFKFMSIQQIAASDAFLKLKNEKNTVLIDVRTDAEFTFVGVPDLRETNSSLILLPWKNFPTMNQNPDFTTKLETNLQEKFGDNSHEAQLIFICLSGGRSQQAALHMTQLGYKNCFNIVSGFEGDTDNLGHRGNINGWKSSHLPWRQ